VDAEGAASKSSPPARFDFGRIIGKHFDWDLVTPVNEIRKFIYGGLAERELLGLLNGDSKLGKMRGFIAFCPLMDSVSQFQELDGWLVNILKRALAEGYRLVDTLAKKSSPKKCHAANY
jgi:hypothetical protein